MKKLATNKKKIYSQPECIVIKLDNEISLALESDPPNPDNESYGQLESIKGFKAEPFRTMT
jgi:hypothetical protein